MARLAGKIPAGPATIIVLIGATIGLRVAFSYAAQSASAPSRARVLTLVSTVGLAISALTMIGVLPHLTKTGGMGTFLTDLVAELWALGILTVVSGQVRTLDWRPLVGALMTGFLAVPALATLLGGRWWRHSGRQVCSPSASGSRSPRSCARRSQSPSSSSSRCEESHPPVGSRSHVARCVDRCRVRPL